MARKDVQKKREEIDAKLNLKHNRWGEGGMPPSRTKTKKGEVTETLSFVNA